MSVRQRAADLLYAMCDRSNAQAIVGEMLSYLETADYSIREEMVLKVAILAEKYAIDYSWYVDTILMLIRVAGDYVSDEVWHRVVQIVVNREDVQAYAAKTVFDVSHLFLPFYTCLRSFFSCSICNHSDVRHARVYSFFQSDFCAFTSVMAGCNKIMDIPPAICCFIRFTFGTLFFVAFQALTAPACHENMVKVGGYILGEFGNLIAGDARSSYVHFPKGYWHFN